MWRKSRHRKRNPSAELLEAREAKNKAAHALTKAQEQKSVTERTVTEPLRKERARLHSENHIVDMIVQTLRREA